MEGIRAFCLDWKFINITVVHKKGGSSYGSGPMETVW